VSALRLTRTGLASFMIETPGGLRLLTDPWFAGNPTQVPEYATPEFLRTLDALLVSHAHLDHAQGVPAALEANPELQVFTTYEFGGLLTRRGLTNVTGVNFGGSVEWRGLTITFVPALHDNAYSSSAGVEWAGLASGILVRLENGYVLYYAGDTGLTAEMDVIGRFWRPDLGILPICGSRLTMDPEQAAFAAGELLRLDRAIGCHDFPAIEDAPDPAAMRVLLERAPILRDALGERGEEFAALMTERHPGIAGTVLGLGDSAELPAVRGAR
jgi:L-ascorbate metabolism protein UlaG (beta-lactamase superfamily)